MDRSYKEFGRCQQIFPLETAKVLGNLVETIREGELKGAECSVKQLNE